MMGACLQPRLVGVPSGPLSTPAYAGASESSPYSLGTLGDPTRLPEVRPMLVAKLIEKHLPPEPDTALVLHALAGDPLAFNTLYLRYVKRITSLVGRMLPNQSECEEVTQ